MGTTFVEIYEDWMLPVINNYKLDNLYKIDKNVLFEFLRVFLKNGLSDFDSVTPLTYHKETVIDEDTNEEYDIYVFDNELDNDEKKIISEIAVSLYWKRQIQDIKARMPYMNQREFKKEATAPIMKQNDLWYNNLVSEYVADIANYNLKHLSQLPFWGDE